MENTHYHVVWLQYFIVNDIDYFTMWQMRWGSFLLEMTPH